MRASTCSRKESPPTINGCNLVKSAISNFLGLSGSCIFFLWSVDMPFVLFLFLLQVSSCLVLFEIFTVAMNSVYYGFAANIHYALWCARFCVAWFSLLSHHSLVVLLLLTFPVETTNWREDLHVVVCP